MKQRKKGFTLVELLVVIGIISLLLAIGLPAFNVVRRQAREVKDKASLHNLATAIEAFKGEVGFYPDSSQRTMLTKGYDSYDGDKIYDQGAHRLFEALVGPDRLGYQKSHLYAVDDLGVPSTKFKNNYSPTKRYGPYVELANVATGTVAGGQPAGAFAGDNDNEVFVDTLTRDNPKPILYYKAHASKHLIGQIYNYVDNFYITTDKVGEDFYHPNFAADDASQFLNAILDTKTSADFSTANARPHNKDSFLLINAGSDGLYGTPDDITNFPVKE